MGGTADRLAHAKREARRATGNPALRAVSRSGYVASALLRVLIGSLALLLAGDVAGAHPGASGAFGVLAAVPGGVVLLVLVAAGNGALCLWLVVQGVLHRDPDVLQRWRQRLVFWGRAVVYAAIGLTAAGFALGAHGVTDRGRRAAGQQLLDVPGGQVLLAVAGAVVVVIGVSMLWIGVRRTFVKTVELPDDERRRRFVLGLGVVAYVAQGATIAGVGITLLVAAWTVDAARVGGLDAALQAFPQSPPGRALLIAIGAGWLVAGSYALVRARIARVA